MQYLEVSLDDGDDGSKANGGVGAHASGARRRKNLLTLAAVGAAAAFVATLPALLMVVPTLHSLNQKSGQMLDVLAERVDNKEIVSKTMHFGELNSHDDSSTNFSRAQRLSNDSRSRMTWV